MPRNRFRALHRVWATLWALALASAATAQTAEPWLRARTPHFTVLTTAGEAHARRAAEALEAFRQAFQRLVPDARVDPLAPTFVLVFDRFESYEPYAPRYDGQAVRVAGSFVGSPLANYLALTLDQEARAWSVAYHELTHLIVSQSLDRPPTWFNEGLAEFYGTLTFADEGTVAELGHLVPEYLTLLRKERWLPLDDLLLVEASSPLYNEGNKRSMFYAQAWALVHYLLAESDRSERLFDFLRRVAERQAVSAAFRAAFGMAPGTLEDDLRKYIARSDWPVQRYPLGGTATAAHAGVRVERVQEAEALCVLAGLLARQDRTSEAQALVQAALGTADACGSCWALLGALHVDRQLDVEGLPFLLKAAGLPLTGEPLAAYQVGASLLRLHERAGEYAIPRAEAIRVSRQALEESVAAMAGYAEAWASLSHVWLEDGTAPDRARDAARRARTLAPSRRHYALLEAQALMQKGDLVTARRMMERLLEADIPQSLADKAMEVLARVTALEDARGRRGAKSGPGR